MDHEYDKSIGKWIVDTDPGVDDAFAIIFGLHFIKDHILALSIEGGNTGVEQCFINAKKICVIDGRGHIPVYKGSKLNLSCKNFAAEDVHGGDGLSDIEKFLNFECKFDINVIKKEHNEKYPILDSHSAMKIIELLYKYDDVNLLTLGPLTNIALAYMLDPNIVNRIKKIFVMGGSYLFDGNLTAGAEFNFGCDPIAAKIIMTNFKNVTIYPWEPSLKHLITIKELDFILEDSERSYFCKELIKRKKLEGGVFADYGAAVASFYPKSIKKSKFVQADIIIDGEHCLHGSLVITKLDKNEHRNKNIVEVVEELHDSMFYNFFKKMIK